MGPIDAELAPAQASWVNSRNQRLHTRTYQLKAPKAILLFHHGYGEHSGRYETGETLC